MFEFLKNHKTCRDCEHYSWYREKNKLLPDKTVIRGELLCESCDEMDARLADLRPCELFERRTRTHNSMHARLLHMQGHSGIPEPPKVGFTIQRGN